MPKKTTPTPFGPALDSLCHPWFTTITFSYRFFILKLPPPPCAALLVNGFFHLHFLELFVCAEQDLCLSIRLHQDIDVNEWLQKARKTMTKDYNDLAVWRIKIDVSNNLDAIAKEILNERRQKMETQFFQNCLLMSWNSRPAPSILFLLKITLAVLDMVKGSIVAFATRCLKAW